MTEPVEVDPNQTIEASARDTYDRVGVAQVNLLPPEITVHRRQRRIAAFSIGLLIAYLGALGLLYVLKLEAVNAARAARDDTQQEVAVLQAEAESLQEYQVLADNVENAETLLTAAMDRELSWARILGDLALAFDQQSSLVGVQAASTEPGVEDVATSTEGTGQTDGAGEIDPGTPVAQVEFTGYSVDRFAPGVEDVLSKFDESAGFFDSYLDTAAEMERGDSEVTDFVGRVKLDDGAYTHRYDDGLPEESVR